MSKFKSALIATIFSIICIGCASQNKFVSAETIEQIKLSTVPVVCGVFENGSFTPKKIMGSAFFINNEGYFLTAEHVFKDWDKIENCKGAIAAAIYLPHEDWQNLDKVRVFFLDENCIKDREIDIAVCKTKDNPFLHTDLKREIRSVTFGSPSAIKDGFPIAFTGFPLDYMRPVTSIGHVASYIAANQIIFIDKNAWPGASGSPAYMIDGKVVGILTIAGINFGAGLAYAHSIEPVLELMRKYNIKFQQEK